MSQPNENNGIILGILFLLGLNFAAFWAWISLLYVLTIINTSIIHLPGIDYILRDYRWIALLIYPGLTQFIYVLPIVFVLMRRRRWGFMKGVIIGAVITALVNGGCFLMFSLH